MSPAKRSSSQSLASLLGTPIRNVLPSAVSTDVFFSHMSYVRFANWNRNSSWTCDQIWSWFNSCPLPSSRRWSKREGARLWIDARNPVDGSQAGSGNAVDNLGQNSLLLSPASPAQLPFQSPRRETQVQPELPFP